MHCSQILESSWDRLEYLFLDGMMEWSSLSGIGILHFVCCFFHICVLIPQSDFMNCSTVNNFKLPLSFIISSAWFDCRSRTLWYTLLKYNIKTSILFFSLYLVTFYRPNNECDCVSCFSDVLCVLSNNGNPCWSLLFF